MQHHPLGRSGIQVSALCLGTMTFGEQNSEAEAHAQLDQALAADINLIDTAEIYPIPLRAQTQGETERHIGSWLARRGCRDRVVLASKVAGPGDWLAHIRGGEENHLNRPHIRAAVEGSLRRLRTDFIDIYQVHWPDRKTNFFGQLGYSQPQSDQSVPIEETLEALDELVREGKVRHIGVSNETPWGLMRYLALAEQRGLPRAVTIQNPYSLLNRSFEIGLAEIAHREACGLLAYSSLGFGVLSGKYLQGRHPPGARLTLFDNYGRYSNPEGEAATAAYVELARSHGLEPAQMALAWVNSRPFVTSTIIGATTPEQLESNLASIDLELTPEVLVGIEAIHTGRPNPCP